MTVADALFRVDDFLLDRVFQPVTDRLGERPSAFDLGISLELGAVVLELAADAVLYAFGELSWSAGIWDGFSCACGMWFYLFMVRQRPLVSAGRPNPLRVIYRSLRLLALGFALWSTFSAIGAIGTPNSGLLSYTLNSLSNFAFVAGMYLISCQPRPPGWRAAQRTASPWVVPSYG